MLTPLDETLMHQAPTTFDHAVTSDHRFFDRWAAGVQHPELSIIYGLATYKNTDTCDGFLCVRRGDRQYNLRLSRPLRPNYAMSVGPLRIEVIEPLVAHRLVVEPSLGSPLHCDLVWRGSLPPREEHPHFQRQNARAVQDYCRFDQLGTATGWVGIGDERVDIRDWFSWRDHSWGVRPGMGGKDQVNAHPIRSGPHNELGSLFIWIAFRAGTVVGQFQLRADSQGRPEMTDGYLIPDTDDPSVSLKVTDIRHDITFVNGHTVFSRARLQATTADRQVWHFDATPLRSPWDFSGAGYSGGWDDSEGLGVPRGEAIEIDEYDMSAPADVRLSDGSTRQHWHRETDVALTVTDAGGAAVHGDGHLTIIARPPLGTPTIES